MARDKFRIGIVAPGKRMDEAHAIELTAFAAARFPAVELVIHPQCFAVHGHFAGMDEARARAFVEYANDETLGAIWWARGGYGAGRIATQVLAHLNAAARRKTYLGYSDAGFLLAGLYAQGFPYIAHGPVAYDLFRQGGEAAASRALEFLTTRDALTLEPHVVPDAKVVGAPHAAFNLTVLSHLMGTELLPDLSGHVLMVEEVSEHLYSLDRDFCHVLPSLPKLKGLYLGRVSDIPENEIPFGQSEEQIARHWCAVTGTPFLGRAEIGHDTDNRIVPFGMWPWQ